MVPAAFSSFKQISSAEEGEHIIQEVVDVRMDECASEEAYDFTSFDHIVGAQTPLPYRLRIVKYHSTDHNECNCCRTLFERIAMSCDVREDLIRPENSVGPKSRLIPIDPHGSKKTLSYDSCIGMW
jgi:hypothetical protein